MFVQDPPDLNKMGPFKVFPLMMNCHPIFAEKFGKLSAITFVFKVF